MVFGIRVLVGCFKSFRLFMVFAAALVIISLGFVVYVRVCVCVCSHLWVLDFVSRAKH